MRCIDANDSGALMSAVPARASAAATTPHVAARSIGCAGNSRLFGPHELSSRALASNNRFNMPVPYTLAASPATVHSEMQAGQMWIGFPVTAIAASFSASLCVGWAWQV